MKRLLVVLVALLFAGCVHDITMIEFSTGQPLKAEYNKLNRTVTVVMPDGEVLTGNYSAVPNASAVFGSSFGSATAVKGASVASASGSSFGYGIAAGGVATAYALLTSQNSNLVMEMMLEYSMWNNHGFGEARTNDGRTYKVQF